MLAGQNGSKSLNASFGSQNLQRRAAVSLDDFTIVGQASLPSLVCRS